MNLTVDELLFAQNHVKNFYSSDFFPDSDVFKALWHSWDEVVDHLTTTPLAELGSMPQTLSASKAGGGFRIVHQPKPLDILAYTAAVYKVAPYLEKARVDKRKNVACSYRIDVDLGSGRFF